MKKLLLSILLLNIMQTSGREGMWLPHLLKELNETEMKSMGMEISAEDIYSINNSSLKDAVLQFGGGCTGELISPKGLLITNHHCGFSQIQSLSTIEKNYLKEGFWSESLGDEIPCPGLTVTFIKEITEVTETILSGLTDTMNEDVRAALIKIKTDSIEKSLDGKFKGIVRAFYQGNKYYLFTTEVFSDIRLVGAPPQSIGKFGGETDNWIWPRHTGDFSLFRIYADKDNKPAAYSKENIPFTPKQFLSVNINGVKEGDFVFIFGFPGRTFEYIPASSLEVIASQTNPNRISIRETRLNILREAMNKNDTIRLQYAAKFSTLENAYKKWKGEQIGFKQLDVLGKKKIQDADFNAGIKNHPLLKRDSLLIEMFDSLNTAAKPLNFAFDYYAEAFPGIELFNLTNRFKTIHSLCADVKKQEKDISDEVLKLKKDLRGFYKNYNPDIDRKICTSVLELMYSKVDKKFIPEAIVAEGEKGNGSFSKFSEKLFRNAILADSSRAIKFLDSFTRRDTVKIIKDPAYKIQTSVSTSQVKIQDELRNYNKSIARLQRIYMNDLILLNTAKKLFPDANSTLRVSYGKVEGVKPVDGMHYSYFTTTDGILAKSEKGISDYKITERLTSLLRNKNFGRYASNGVLPVAFLASVHTTGGSSGSPALNSKGELVGINYDRIWEGVVSDYYYDERNSRNICLDIRYALYIIEKYGNAERLISEMRIVN